MRRLLPCLLLGLTPLWPQSLSRGERDYAMSQLHATRKMFLDALAGLSDAQFRFKPSPERWSIAECAEHILLTEDFLFERLRRALHSPAQPDRKAAQEDAKVYETAVDRSRKVQASEPAILPQGRWKSPEELAAQFRQRRDRTIAYVESTQDPLRAHFTGPAPEALDAYQLLILMAGHTERHVAQINEVKADPKFPRP